MPSPNLRVSHFLFGVVAPTRDKGANFPIRMIWGVFFLYNMQWEMILIYHMHLSNTYLFYYIPRVFIPLCDLKRYPPTISSEDYLMVERDENYVKMILLTK